MGKYSKPQRAQLAKPVSPASAPTQQELGDDPREVPADQSPAEAKSIPGTYAAPARRRRSLVTIHVPRTINVGLGGLLATILPIASAIFFTGWYARQVLSQIEQAQAETHRNTQQIGEVSGQSQALSQKLELTGRTVDEVRQKLEEHRRATESKEQPPK